MPTTLSLPFVRFTRQAYAGPATITAWKSTLAQAVEALKVASWVRAPQDTTVELPQNDPTGQTQGAMFDAFKASGDAADSKESAYLGMTAYRFKIPSDATSGTPANVTSIALQVAADKFLWKGLLISAYVSSSDTPSTDWTVLATGDVATPVDSLGRGVLYEDAPATKNATNKLETVTLTPASPIAPNSYLWIIIQLAGWTSDKYEYWIEGSGMLLGSLCEVTFSRSVTADVPSATYEFPVEPAQLETPSTVFPLDAVRGYLSTMTWGKNEDGILTIPSGLETVRMLSAQYRHVAALKADGTVVCWGLNTSGQTTVPGGLTGVVAVAAGILRTIALKGDGTAVVWGGDSYGITAVVTAWTDLVAVADGYEFSVGLKKDGTIVSAGLDTYGQLTGLDAVTGAVAVGAGYDYTIVLLDDGTVDVFGGEGALEPPVGLSNVVHIAAGRSHWLALKSDGTVVGSGLDNEGQVSGVSSWTNIVSVAAGPYSSIGIKSDGTVVAVGDFNSASVPASLSDVRLIAAARGPSSPAGDGAIAAYSTYGGWQRATIRAPASYVNASMPDIDPDAQRRLKAVRCVSSALGSALSIKESEGKIGLVDFSDRVEMYATTRAVMWEFASEEPSPNRLALMLPDLSADAEDHTFLRIAFLKDNNAVPTNPLATVANFRTVWQGGTPSGYTQLASAYVKHTGFVNSQMLTLSAPGASGIGWLVILPVYVPGTGTSLAWDFEQTGFDSDTVFMLRA